MDDLIGVVVADRYTIDREIGRGGMAIVWLAHDAQHSRRVAIKTLHSDLAGAIGADRFLREIQLTAQLQHPGIVPILDSGILGRPGGTIVPWYAMPYLEGESLRVRLSREGQLSIEESLRITDAVGNALEAAHRQQVIHRDIKPDNVFLVGEHVYVVDFGIAKAIAASETENLTSTGLTIGTPAYMSPEQAVAGTVEARSDQYSLACILYEMLAGEPPFSGPNAQSIIARRLVEPARSLSTVRSTVPQAVERATLRALERTPADRFPSVSAFLAALRKPELPPGHPGRERRVRRVVLAAGLTAVVGLVAWYLTSRDEVRWGRTVDPEVVALHQRGVRAYEKRTPAGAAEAIASLRAAITRDSVYAPAWNALAKTYVRAYARSFRVPGVPHERLLPLAVDAVDRSLAVDRESADAWLTHGQVSHQVDPVDLAPSLRSIRRSIELDSTIAESWHSLAILLADSGDLNSALAAWRRCVRVDPGYAQGLAFLALAHHWRRNFDSAAVWADSALRVDPNYLLARQAAGHIAVERGHFDRAEAAFEAARRVSTDVEVVNALAGIALARARSGRVADARAVLQRIESLAAAYDPMPMHTAIYVSQAYAALGDAGRSLRVLGRFEPVQHTHFQLHLRCDPPFAPIAQDQRFRVLLVTARPAEGKGC